MMDFMEYLGQDTSIRVFLLLDDPSDLVRVATVSRAWRRFVIYNGFCKKLCLRICPEVSVISGVTEFNTILEFVGDVGSSSTVEWKKLQSEHRIYSYLNRCIVLSLWESSCISDTISASSTDNYPDESIENTLEPRDRLIASTSYWSSVGQSSPFVPEALTYRLCSKLCVINEIKIQPFEAYFQNEHPIYSAQGVRFRIGYTRSSQETGDDMEHATGHDDDNYVWTFVSPIFRMLQENILQTFKLPRPILGIGGVLQIELLGRQQKQQLDGLYYIRICHVQAIGRPLSPVLDVDVNDTSEGLVLEYLPAAIFSAFKEQQSIYLTGGYFSTRRNNMPPGIMGWIVNALVNTGLIVYESDSSDEEY